MLLISCQKFKIGSREHTLLKLIVGGGGVNHRESQCRLHIHVNTTTGRQALISASDKSHLENEYCTVLIIHGLF